MKLTDLPASRFTFLEELTEPKSSMYFLKIKRMTQPTINNGTGSLIRMGFIKKIFLKNNSRWTKRRLRDLVGYKLTVKGEHFRTVIGFAEMMLDTDFDALRFFSETMIDLLVKSGGLKEPVSVNSITNEYINILKKELAKFQSPQHLNNKKV